MIIPIVRRVKSNSVDVSGTDGQSVQRLRRRGCEVEHIFGGVDRQRRYVAVDHHMQHLVRVPPYRVWNQLQHMVHRRH